MDTLQQAFSRLTSRAKQVIIICLLCFSAPSLASESFTFIDYNFAFVLGLSLPFLLTTSLLAKKIPVNWYFPAAITASLLLLFYVIAHPTLTQQHAWILTSAIAFLAFTYLWPYFNFSEKNHTQQKVTVALISFIALAFIFSIWLLPSINAYFSWLIVSGIILVVALLRVLQFVSSPTLNSSRLILQWLLSCFYAVSVYLWLNTQLNINLLVIACVATYLLTLINGCWFLVQKIYQNLAIETPKSSEKVTIDDLFAYTHDMATNLPTVQHALNQFEQEYRHNKAPNYAAIVFQPVNFAQVNAILGHHNSDVLLLQLAYCLQEKTSNVEALITFEQPLSAIKLARLQGLRFLVILDLSNNHHPEKTVINDVCKQIAASVPNAMSFKSFSLNFELAFGVSLINNHNDNLTKFIAHAEDALLQAQKKKRFIQYFDDSQIIYTEQQLAKMEALKHAIEEQQLHWFIQPQINLTNKRIIGFSLSASWQYQDKKLSLNEFIKTAEHSGDIYLLAKQLVTQAFKLLFLLHQSGHYQHVAINLSSKQLLEPDLIHYIEQQRDRYNIATKYLIVELNEDIIFSENEYAKIFTDQLKSLDIGIAISNFSGSYDTLRFLRKALVSRIKVNCQYLNDKAEMATDKAIINSLINLASTMKIPLIATHIDDKFTEEIYSAMGGELAQGKVITNDIVPEQISTWLQAWYQQYPEAKSK